MRKFVFATNNEHKLRELRQILNGEFVLLSLNDIGCNEEIPETGTTLEFNASQKSHYIWEKYGIDCFADDTGLEIKALNNEPGVYSARYAGEAKSSEANIQKVLEKMKDIEDRRARFRCVFSLIMTEFRRINQYQGFSVNTPAQYALAEFLQEGQNFSEMCSYHQSKRDYFIDLIGNSNFNAIPTASTYYQLLDYSKISELNDVDFAIKLINDYGVATVPFSAFMHVQIRYN